MNFLFLYHMRQRKLLLPFYRWEMKQWLIPGGTGESSYLKCILLQGSLAGHEEQRKNKAITLKNPLSSQQWHGITQQDWRQRSEQGRPEKRTRRDNSWGWEQLKLPDQIFGLLQNSSTDFAQTSRHLLLCFPQFTEKWIGQIFLPLSQSFHY